MHIPDGYLSPQTELVFGAAMVPVWYTAMLGAIPLALGAGDGAEMRRPLGIAIVGGLIVSQALTLYTTPVVYLYLDRFRLWAARSRTRRHPRDAAPVTP